MIKIEIEPVTTNYIASGEMSIAEKDGYLEYSRAGGGTGSFKSKQSFDFISKIEIEFYYHINGGCHNNLYFGNLLRIKNGYCGNGQISINGEVIASSNSIGNGLKRWNVSIGSTSYAIFIDDELFVKGILSKQIEPQKFNIEVYANNIGPTKFGRVILILLCLIKSNNKYYTYKNNEFEK